jgi:hypothetical protein
MQDKERKYFASPDGRLNSDDAAAFIRINEWVNSENVRIGSTDKGVTGTVESIGSTRLLSTPQPSVTFLGIGSVDEVARNRFVEFKFDKTGNNHRIVCWDEDAQTEYVVLLSSQVTGGLNFSKNSIIHSAAIVDGMLYWPDGTNNSPRKINIDAAIKANQSAYVTDVVPYTFPINFSEITVIKHPPPLAPNIQKTTDVTFENNFIANDSFMFAFRYVWYDNETTVLGVYSPASRLNKANATENYIAVTMDSLESIPDTVRIVQLIVRYSNSNNAFVAKKWDKEVTTEAQEIADQNSGTQVLTFNYYNTITGQFIPNGLNFDGSPNGLPNLVLKPFDSVPIYARAMAAFRNRIGFGNNTEGYDTPGTTSLSFSLTEINLAIASFQKNLIQLYHRNGRSGDINYAYSAWYVYLTEVVPNGYYELTSTAQTTSPSSSPYPTLPPAPGTFAFGGLTFRGSSLSQVAKATAPVGTTRWDGPITITTSSLVSITGVSIQAYDIFKTQSQYQGGVVFYDFAMRKCGVVTNDGCIFEIPPRDFYFTSGVSGAVWTLSNTNALNEIPDWAYYYAVVRTLNLRTRYFIDSFTNAARYATKDTDGNWIFTSTTFVTGVLGIGLNTNALVQSGLGYQFQEGDVCILIRDDDTIYQLPVIGQNGNYIIVKAADAGDLTTRSFAFEIYSPYRTSDQESYYEIGQLYRIANPGTELRSYEILSDIFPPDAYVLTRTFASTTYFAEAMSPNDLYFQRWDTDAGKINLITRLGQVVKKNSISFSNNYIPNTAINGLSTFDAGDEKPIPNECGAILKMILTSKVQDEIGVVMLVGCQQETVSVYVGETQLLGSAGNASLVTTEQVLGTVNVLKGNYGTVNPEAWVEFRGIVIFPDANNGKWIQYASNGLFPISNYKMTRFWQEWFKQFLSMTSEEIEALGGRPFIFTTVDPYHMELLISIPKLLNIPPKGYLPDYTENVYVKDAYEIRQGYFSSDEAPASYYYGIFVFLTETQPNGYYLIPATQSYGVSPPVSVIPPSSVNQSDLVFVGSTLEDVLNNTMPEGASRFEESLVDSGYDVTITGVRNLTIYPFDILDFQGKTIVYQLDKGNGMPKWMGSYAFNPEGFITLQNKLFMFKDGHIWIGNQTTSYNNFFDIQYKSKIMFVSNQNPAIPKVYNNIALKVNMKPTLTYLYTDAPVQQCSDLVDFDYRPLEGNLYAVFYRNKITPTATGYSVSGLLINEKMRSASMFIMLEFTVSITPLELEFVSVGFENSLGQTI